MAVKIKNPNATSGHSGMGSGAVGGAAQGAAAGAMVGGPVGAVVGGVIGAIGGALGGGAMDKAEYYKKLAAKYDTMGRERQQAIAIRDQLRQFRMKRAMAMTAIGSEEGGTRSSSPQGAVDSLGAQYGFDYAYTEGQIYLQRQSAKFMRKAGRKMAQANTTFAYMDAASSFAQVGASAWGAWQANRPVKPISSSQANEAFSTIPAFEPKI